VNTTTKLRFHKMLGNSWVAEQLLAFKDSVPWSWLDTVRFMSLDIWREQIRSCHGITNLLFLMCIAAAAAAAAVGNWCQNAICRNTVMYFAVTTDGVWIGYWIYWHNSELQVITTLSLISTLYKSLAHTKSSQSTKSHRGNRF
jgi:hypothetical protein